MVRGEVYLLDLKDPIGNVQAGIRPVIVIQNNIGNLYSPTTIVCCVTSANKKWLPTHCYVKGGGLRQRSIALCEQLFTVNKSDLKQKIGAITNKITLKRLDKCIRLSLGI